MSRHFVLILLAAVAFSASLRPAFAQTQSSRQEEVDPWILASNALLQVNCFLTSTQFSQLATTAAKWKDARPDEKHILIQELQFRLSSTKSLALGASSDVIVRHRLEKGEMAFHGDGVIVDQDIFCEGGRAAWALEQMLDVKLPTITEDMNPHDLSNDVQRIKSTINARIVPGSVP